MKKHLFIFPAIFILAFCTFFCSNTTTNEEDDKTIIVSESVGDNNYFTEERVCDDLGLIVYYPHFKRIDLVCGMQPSEDDTTIIYCAAAAFTAHILNSFRHDNIRGSHVCDGKAYYDDEEWAKGKTIGYFTYFNGKWYIGKDFSLEDVAQRGGMAFTQWWIVKSCEVVKPYHRKPPSEQNVYRSLCQKGDTLCIVQSNVIQRYDDYMASLKAFGVDNALYLDMVPVWNYSFWRDGNDSLHHFATKPAKESDHRTNWIVFYGK